MSPKLRLWFFVILGLSFGVLIGVDIADESYGWGILAALVIGWLLIEKTSEAPPDAWILGAVLMGYIVGNRGFAQLQPASQIPLLPAEAVLLVAVPALIARMAMKRTAAVRKDALNCAIIAWVAIGAIRLPLDINRYGFVALRDFATIYYTAFFFIAQAFGSQAASAKVLRSSLTIAFVVLAPVVISIQLAPDFLFNYFTWHGVPIIYQKSDLIATSLAAGFFWLWTRGMKSGNRLWFVPAAANLLCIGLMASPRAAMTAIAATTVLWLVVGRWRIAAAQLGLVVSASLLTLAVLWISGKDVRTSAPYSAYEHAVSIFDPEGTGSYINGESGDPGDNNRFRMIWWHDVIAETVETNPLFGLGFGSDLASRFLADYDLLSDETFSARSPHSMMVTVFGRMGIVGFLAWLAVSAAIARIVWRLFRQGDADGIGLASIACVTWVSACFGVVLEGPMGAVVFWTVVGLANARMRTPPPTGPGPDESAGGDWPIAKPGALDTESTLR